MNTLVDDRYHVRVGRRQILKWLDVLGVASKRQLLAALDDGSRGRTSSIDGVIHQLLAEGVLRQVHAQRPVLYAGRHCPADLPGALGLADLTIALDRSLRSLGYPPRWICAGAGSPHVARTGLALVRVPSGPTPVAFIVHYNEQQPQWQILECLRTLLVLSCDVGRFFGASQVCVLASLDCRPRAQAELRLVSLVQALGHNHLYLADHSRLRRMLAPDVLTAPIWYHREETEPVAMLTVNSAPLALTNPSGA